MLRQALTILLLAATLSGGEFVKQAVTFRLKKSAREHVRGWVLAVDTDGFRFERFGTKKRDFVPWDAVVFADARRLRLHFEIDWLKDVEIERVPGHRLHLLGGGNVDGLLLRIDKQKRHWLKTDGMVLPYPSDRIANVEEMELDETAIYNKHEVYLRRLERTPPKSAAQQRDLAEYMFDLGNWEKAAKHYQEAARGQPMWAPEIDGRVADILYILKDQRASKALAKAKYWATLHGDFKRARRMINEFIEKNPDSKRRGIKVLDQIEELRHRKLQRRFHRVKHEEFDRTVKSYLRRTMPDFATALAWLEKEMAKLVKDRVRSRLTISDEEYAELSKTRAGGAPHFATYWSGTFIVNKRSGRKGKRPGHDPEYWWTTYDNSSTRATWMKAYASEHNPSLFEVVNIRFHDCERCGGKGYVRILNLNPRGKQPMEYNETCPRCFGARRDRAVAYR